MNQTTTDSHDSADHGVRAPRRPRGRAAAALAGLLAALAAAAPAVRADGAGSPAGPQGSDTASPAAGATAPEVVHLTLPDALARAQAHYPTVEAALAAIDAARAGTTVQEAARRPQLSAGAAYGYTSIRPYVAIALPGLPAGAIYENVQDSIGATLTVREQLTDFGRTRALVELARTGEASARDALEAVRRQLGYSVIQSYYGVLLLGRSAGVADEEITALQEALRIAQRRLEQGSATRLDVLSTEVRLANARNRRTDIGAALVRQEAALRRLAGLPPGTAVAAEGSFDTGRPVPTLAEAVAAGLEGRPDARLARDAEASALVRVDAAGREMRPVLAAQATAGVDNGNVPNLYARRGYATAGVSLSVPLLNGGRASGDRLEASSTLRSARAGIAEVAAVVGDEVESALADLSAAGARLGSADTLVDQATEALALARTRYTNGVITNFELLDAQSAARAAELSRLQARYDWAVAWQALSRASGRPPAP